MYQYLLVGTKTKWALSYNRYKDGRPVVKDSSTTLLRNFDQRDLGLEDSLGETISHLSLDCVDENDAGYYECVAHNSNGQKTTVGTEVNVVSKFFQLKLFTFNLYN